jgi:hypothetical protein
VEAVLDLLLRHLDGGREATEGGDDAGVRGWSPV